MAVIYLDSVFMINTAMDYFLCLLTARLAGIPLCRKRYLIAALLGGLYATAIFLPKTAWLSTPLAQICVFFLMAMISYGREPRLFRLILLFCLLSCVMAGAVLGLSFFLSTMEAASPNHFYLNPRITILFLAVAGIGIILRFIFQPSIQNGIQGKLLPIRLSIGGKICSVTAFWDTGNQLRDPVHGQPVLVVSPEAIKQLLPKEIQDFLKQKQDVFPMDLLENVHSYTPELKPYLLSYRAIGNPTGMLCAVRSDWIEIRGVRYPNTAVALAPSVLGNGYEALWGGDLKHGGHYEIFGQTTSIPTK